MVPDSTSWNSAHSEPHTCPSLVPATMAFASRPHTRYWIATWRRVVVSSPPQIHSGVSDEIIARLREKAAAIVHGDIARHDGDYGLTELALEGEVLVVPSIAQDIGMSPVTMATDIFIRCMSSIW